MAFGEGVGLKYTYLSVGISIVGFGQMREEKTLSSAAAASWLRRVQEFSVAGVE